MVEVLDWQRGDPREMLERALGELTAGRLVVFPTESGYHVAASALSSQAWTELSQLSRPAEGFVAVASLAAAASWIPSPSSIAKRLARRVWPGSVLICVSPVEGAPAPLAIEADPTAVRLCLPGHDAPWGALELGNAPLLMAPLAEDALVPEQLAERLRDRVALLLADPQTPAWSPPMSVFVRGDRWSIIRANEDDAARLQSQMATTVLFICTGNTCRSPMAEAFCKKLLADHLGCQPAELPARGFMVLSAGLAAMMGIEASPEAVDVARDCGADLSEHRSQPLTAELLRRADFVFTMTQSHLRALLPFCAEGGPELQLLAPDGLDVPDPIGATPDVYRECSERILGYLKHRLPEIQPA
jgi:protein-tyrosine-phosphatase